MLTRVEYNLTHNKSSVRNESCLLERLGHVNVALESTTWECCREARHGCARLALHRLRQFKQCRLGRQRLHDVAARRLQSQPCFGVVGLWLWRRSRCGLSGGGGSGSLWCSALAGCLCLLGLALAIRLVGFNLGLDALLGLNVIQLLLAFSGRLLDLFLAFQLLL